MTRACSNCGASGHNRQTCRVPAAPQPLTPTAAERERVEAVVRGFAEPLAAAFGCNLANVRVRVRNDMEIGGPWLAWVEDNCIAVGRPSWPHVVAEAASGDAVIAGLRNGLVAALATIVEEQQDAAMVAATRAGRLLAALVEVARP